MAFGQHILPSICEYQGWKLHSASPLFGGDINQVYHIHTSHGEFAVKLNDSTRYPGMFEAEKYGLEKLAASKSFRIPGRVNTGELDSCAYLILEYIQQGNQSKNFWETFAENLVKLHRNTNECFGLPNSNYIGSLPQPNRWCETASEFYITQRLEPQLKMARDSGNSFPGLNLFFRNVEYLIPEDVPALIHGDLWNGNYMTDVSGDPVLIDPAVSFGIREMDLAMMRLFGGFPDRIHQVYFELSPVETGYEERISLYQLYYLLVHLNLFGRGYLSQVRGIIERYS